MCIALPVIDPSWNLMSTHPTPIAINASVKFACANETKAETNFGMKHQTATCREDNTWETPDWIRCVESTYS